MATNISNWAFCTKPHFKREKSYLVPPEATSFNFQQLLNLAWVAVLLVVIEQQFERRCALQRRIHPVGLARHAKSAQCNASCTARSKMFPLCCGEKSSLDLKEFPCICWQARDGGWIYNSTLRGTAARALSLSTTAVRLLHCMPHSIVGPTCVGCPSGTLQPYTHTFGQQLLGILFSHTKLNPFGQATLLLHSLDALLFGCHENFEAMPHPGSNSRGQSGFIQNIHTTWQLTFSSFLQQN